MKVQTDFKQIFLQQQGDQISLCQKNPKDGVQIKQQKGKKIPIHLQDQVAKDI